jgi:hypothetical protein
MELGKLEGLIICGTNMDDCATKLGISKDTLERNYRDTINKFRVDRNLQIRRKLWDLAMSGNISALIWLSKQWCGMRDQVTLGEDPEHRFGSNTQIMEIVFIDSDGDGRPKNAIEVLPPQLTEGK